MKAITFEKIGLPTEVLELSDVPVPEIEENEVLVRMVSASINPGDFLFIANLYPEPKRPVFPRQIAGNHGAGIIEKVGKNVSHKVGTLVAFSYSDTWAEYAAVPSDWLYHLPADYPLAKAGQFFNLITASDLCKAARVKAGDWVAITACNSTVSMMALQFAKKKGANVIAFVRNVRDDLKELGASEVIELSKLTTGVGDRVREITGGKGINSLIDNVGGPVTGELIRSMTFGGQVIINGGMSSERFELHNFDVLLNGVDIRSHIWRHFFTPPKPSEMAELAEIAAASISEDFKVTVGGVHALEGFAAAILKSVQQPEHGKHFFGQF